MTTLLVEEKSIVIPGQALAEGMDFLPGDNTYREGEKIMTNVLGLVSTKGRVLKVTPLAGPYLPKIGDKIIAKVFDITMTGWRVDTATAYSALLNVRDASSRFIRKQEDLSEIIGIDEYVLVKITNVTSQRLIDVTMKEPGLHKLEGGRIIKMSPMKVPRVIGKQGSMIGLVKEKTGTQISVGQNGLVHIKGSPEGELKAAQAISFIEKNAHISGLTQKVEELLG